MTETSYNIRPARVEDLHALPRIEQSAGTLFRQVQDEQLALLADDTPMSAEDHEQSMKEWLSQKLDVAGTWIATHERIDGKEKPVAFIVMGLVRSARSTSGSLVNHITVVPKAPCFIYIKELSVHIDHQRKGLARELVKTAQECAKSISMAGVVSKGVGLVTMRDVSFNKPYYQKLGFEEILHANDIEQQSGSAAVEILQKDQQIFSGKGDGSMAYRRCWMWWSLES